MRAKRIDW